MDIFGVEMNINPTAFFVCNTQNFRGFKIIVDSEVQNVTFFSFRIITSQNRKSFITLTYCIVFLHIIKFIKLYLELQRLGLQPIHENEDILVDLKVQEFAQIQ